MIKIAVLCNLQQNLQLKEYLLHYSINNNNDITIKIFITYDELYKSLCNNYSYDLIFVDTDYETQKALQIAYHIRKELLDEETAIVFMSSAEKCSSEMIKMHLFDYLIYPLNYERVQRCIDNYIKINYINPDMFGYKKNKFEYKIAASRIVYLQSSGRKIIICTKNDKIEFYGRLSDCLKEKCFRNFIKIHQSFVVNPMYIEQVERKYLIVIGNTKLPISRQKLKNVKEYFEK